MSVFSLESVGAYNPDAAPPPAGSCPWCSMPPHQTTFHSGLCPRVKAIEYHPNGTVKRVEFHGDPS